MQVLETYIKDLLIIQPDIFLDERGYFLESWNSQKFSKLGINYNFVQYNHSKSKKGVLRGLHFQTQKAQSKLVRVVSGEVLDVAVDLRPFSETYGKYFSIILSGAKNNQLLIPKGFAHGFFVRSEEAHFLYKTDEYYYPEYEKTLLWNDDEINIDWKLKDIIPSISEKDMHGKTFQQIKKELD